MATIVLLVKFVANQINKQIYLELPYKNTLLRNLLRNWGFKSQVATQNEHVILDMQACNPNC